MMVRSVCLYVLLSVRPPVCLSHAPREKTVRLTCDHYGTLTESRMLEVQSTGQRGYMTTGSGR